MTTRGEAIAHGRPIVRPALVRRNANAQVAKPSAVGITPR